MKERENRKERNQDLSGCTMTAGGVHGKRVYPERQRRHGDSGSSVEEKEDGRVKNEREYRLPLRKQGRILYIIPQQRNDIY